MSCSQCADTLEKLLELEAKSNERYEEYRECALNYQISNAKENATVDGIALQLKTLGDSFIKHMEDEKTYNMLISEHMAATNEILKNVPTKDELQKERGRINTIWVIGVIVLFILGGMGSYLMLEGVKSHTTKASKINYQGTKKLIKDIK